MAKKRISDFHVQAQNANNHTVKGMRLLGETISDLGWIGAITVAANDEVFDGSARLETIAEQMTAEPIVIDVQGDRPVIVRRTDIPTADDPKAKELAIAANRVAELNLNWDLAIIEELKDEIPIDKYFRDDELAKLETTDLNFDEELDEATQEALTAERYPLAIVLTYAELQDWKEIKEMLGVKSDYDALMTLISSYNQ